MASEEKRAWIFASVSAVTYAVYLVIVLGRVGETPVTQVHYRSALLWMVGVSVVSSIVLNIAVGVGSRGAKKDQRDREIARFGDHVGQSLVVAGGVAALLLAMVEADYFWIANVLYLGFTLSALLGSTAKIVAYRRGFHPW